MNINHLPRHAGFVAVLALAAGSLALSAQPPFRGSDSRLTGTYELEPSRGPCAGLTNQLISPNGEGDVYSCLLRPARPQQ